jgi:hypothetical protein
VTEDSILIAIVAAVWTALALLYAFVPMLGMPGGALVWGAGAAIFAALAALTAAAERPRGPER